MSRNMDTREFSRVSEKVEILHGDRPRAFESAAVRRRNLAHLSRLVPKSARAVGTTPTSEELDLIVDDVAEIMRVLRSMADKAGR